MAITTFNIPSNLAPAYNPFNIVLESDNVNEPSFRYVVELKNALDGDSLITRLNLVPRATDSIGYTDISKIVQNLVSYQIPSGNFDDGNLGSYAKVKIEVGEMYAVSYNYTDIQQNGLYVELIGSGATTYVPGDQINIAQSDGGVAMPNMEGLFTVVSVSGNDVTISRLWVDITYSAVGGDVTYADNRKTEFLNLDNELVEFINASFNFKDFQSYDENDWIVNISTDENIFTDSNKYGRLTVKPDQDFFATVYNNLTGNYKVSIRAQNTSGNMNYEYAVTNANPCQQVRIMGDFGTITTIGLATLPVIKSDTEVIRIQIAQGLDKCSQDYFFNIDHSCEINDTQIMFLDRKGGWGSFAFGLKDKQTIKAKKNIYQKELGTVDNTGFSYELNDTGFETYYANIEEEWELNTNWMSEENSLYFEQLVSSPKAFIKIDGVYYAINILTEQTERERFKNKHLIRKTITIKFSNPEYING